MAISGKLNASRTSTASCDDLDISIIDSGDAAGTIVINGGAVPPRLRKIALSNTNERNPLRKAGIAFGGSSARALRRLLLWLPRLLAARRDFDVLSGMSERELRDIGLTRADVRDISALPSDASPTEFLPARIAERRPTREGTSPAMMHSPQGELVSPALPPAPEHI